MNSIDFKLNSQQQKAVLDTEGAILVIAGAGSGKTRVLTARICHLIEMGVSPYNILAITFTNKAANEMKERIATSLGGENNVWTSTFHSMCARMLRQDIDLIGYGKDFSIYTEQESERVVKRICADYPEADPKKKSEYLWHISRAKTLCMSPAEYYESIKQDENDALVIAQVYKRYEEELTRSNCLDFDDLLLKTIVLFKKRPEVLEKYQQRFHYINVDEFQDTNKIQYELVRMLSQKSGNLFVVGDEDQSIYSWRGADIRNILDFPKDFAGAKVYKLEQNYRSTTSILDAANNVIKNNLNRNAKTLWSECRDNNSIEYWDARNDREEASEVARAIDVLRRRGVDFKDCAVLVRANSLTRLFEEEFNLHGMPYKVFGGFRFFERKEIKDTLAYVRLAINPSDNDSILRVVNYPKRGIGNSAVEELKEVAQKYNTTLFGALINPNWLSNTVAKKLAGFTQIALDLVSKSKTLNAEDFIKYVVDHSGLRTYLSSSKDSEDENRLENIDELINAVSEYCNDNQGATISDFVQSVALVADTDEMDDENYITIATVHAVKGLEFDNVFIVGLEEGIFPTQRAINSGDIEEERRLMYVAITRARRKLFVLNARSRYRFGHVENLPQSRFVGEMTGAKRSIRYSNSTYGQDARAKAEYEPKFKLGANNPTSATYASKNTQKTSATAATTVNFDKFQKGTMVVHSKFGDGIIIETSGEGEDKIASIAFKGLGVKRFVLAIAAASLTVK